MFSHSPFVFVFNHCAWFLQDWCQCPLLLFFSLMKYKVLTLIFLLLFAFDCYHNGVSMLTGKDTLQFCDRKEKSAGDFFIPFNHYSHWRMDMVYTLKEIIRFFDSLSSTEQSCTTHKVIWWDWEHTIYIYMCVYMYI